MKIREMMDHSPLKRDPNQEKDPKDQALKQVLLGQKETICFPIEGLPPANFAECELVKVEGYPDIFAIVSHKQTGCVGYTSNPDLFSNITHHQKTSADYYE